MKRRDFLGTLGPGAFLLCSGRYSGVAAARPRSGGMLPPDSIDKYVSDLIIPPPMPKSDKLSRWLGRVVDYYEIAVRQFRQQILPPGLPPTTVWSYGAAGKPASFNYPAFTIEADWGKPAVVKWINQLVDSQGNYLPHLLPVDPTLHWANPPGGVAGRDSRPSFRHTPGPYTGPVPIVTHVHGAHVGEESDGYAEAWFLPAAKNIPGSYARTGTFYDKFRSSTLLGRIWTPGSATFLYPNDQRATTLWYHDHTLGITRANVYAGPAGFYLLRGGPGDIVSGRLPGPAPVAGDPSGTSYYEIPIAIQDRTFNQDGSLFYPVSREFFDDFPGPYIPQTDVPPIWNPEFFGNTMVVNGRTWPKLQVETRRYRFRLLNGCNARFLILKITDNPTERPANAELPFWQIGAEGGFLPRPVQLEQLLMAPAERADVIVDFTGIRPGTTLYLVNLGPDEPFGGGAPGTDFDVADPQTTGQVMQFEVVARRSDDQSTPPRKLELPPPPPLGAHSVVRQLSLNEVMSMSGFDGPVEALLGTVDNGDGVPRMWSDPVTEDPRRGSTELWEIWNFTVDAHPIHVHLVQFQVMNRQPFDGAARPPEPWESGRKDTVIANPGEITRIKAKFTLPGRYVWHCHIVEHEDNEMMRPFQVR